METFKIKISPEVLRLDISTEKYSGQTFGYYSGLTKYLSQTKITEVDYIRNSPNFPGGFLFLSGDFTVPVGYDNYELLINRFSAGGQDLLIFWQTLPVNTKITFQLSEEEIFEFFEIGRAHV